MTTVGFIGMGRMGSRIATNINKKYKTYVWNRTTEKAYDHSIENGTIYAENLEDISSNCDVILLCLKT